MLHSAAIMKRVTVNFDDEVGRRLRAKAAAQKRSVSGYIMLLVEEDVKVSALRAQEQVLAAAAEVGFDRALEILAREMRKEVEVT